VIATGDTTSGLTQIIGGCNDDGARLGGTNQRTSFGS
jgi:hypothetical protein